MAGIDEYDESHCIGREIHQINPFNKLLEDVRQELKPKELREIWTLVKDKLPASYIKKDELPTHEEIDELFSILCKTLDDDVLVVSHLKRAFETTGFYYTASGKYHGQKISKIFEDYDVELKEWNKIYGRDKNFVGRKDYIEQIIQDINSKNIKAVSICGLGGMGKTSLATEICWLLNNQSDVTVVKINMRGVISTREMLEQLLHKVGISNTDEHMLTSPSHFIKHLNTRVEKGTLLFLDEVDDLVKPAGSAHVNFLNLLKEILEGLNNEKVKFLLTSRYKLVHPDALESTQVGKKESRFSGLLQEFELKELSNREAVEVLQKRLSTLELNFDKLTIGSTTALAYRTLAQLAEVCRGMPLALWMVEDQLRAGVDPSDLINRLQSGNFLLSESEKMNEIISGPFKSLPARYQKVMIQLSVFFTTFTLKAASCVLEEDEVETELCLHYLKSRHLVETEDTSTFENDFADETKQRRIVYSLHPLIQKYLHEIKDKKLKEKAMLKFLEYFNTFLDKRASEAEANCIIATRKTFDQIQYIFQATQNMDKLDLPNISGGADYLRLLKRLRFMIIVFQCHSTRLEYFQRMAKLAESRKDDLWHMTMQCWVADHLMLVDPQQGTKKANKILKKIKQQVESMYKDGVNNKREGLELLYALCCYVNARVCKNMHNFHDALKDAKTAQLIFKKYDKKDLHLARAYNLSGHIYHLMNESEESLKYHRKAYRLTKKTVKDCHHFDLVEYIMNIGSCYHKKGQTLHDTAGGLKAAMEDYRHALKWYEKSLKIHKDMNMEDSSRTYNVLVNMTSLCIDMKDFNAALNHAKPAEQIATKYMAENPIDQVKCIITLGHIYRKLAKKKEMNNMAENAQQMHLKSEPNFNRAMEMIQTKRLKASDIGRAYGDLSIGYPIVLQTLGLAKLDKMKKLLDAMDKTIPLKTRERWKNVDSEPDKISESSSSSSDSLSENETFDFNTNDVGDTTVGLSESRKRRKKKQNKEDSDSDSSTKSSPSKRARKDDEDSSDDSTCFEDFNEPSTSSTKFKSRKECSVS